MDKTLLALADVPISATYFVPVEDTYNRTIADMTGFMLSGSLISCDSFQSCNIRHFMQLIIMYKLCPYVYDSSSVTEISTDKSFSWVSNFTSKIMETIIAYPKPCDQRSEDVDMDVLYPFPVRSTWWIAGKRQMTSRLAILFL